MPIQSSSATFVRYFLPDPLPVDFWSYVEEKLNAGRFRECEEGLEWSAGFTSWDDFFEDSFEYSTYHKGEYVAFHFRVDQKKVPPMVLKQHMREAVRKHRDENGGKWPSRHQRQEMLETVRTMLLSRAFPKPGGFDVVWSPSARWMLLGTTSSKMLEIFMEHFEKHFRLYPLPLFHVNWASHLVPLDERRKDSLNSMVSGGIRALEEGGFLGYEFLTWLWFFIEQPHELLCLPQDRKAEIHLGERMILSLPQGGKERIVCTTQANALHEARTALRQGKQVEQIQLFLRAGDNEYLFTLDSTLWSLKGLKTPKQLPAQREDDADGRFLEKMYFLEEVFSALNLLYERFLRERLDSSWESGTLKLMQHWIESGKEPDEGVAGSSGQDVPF